MMEWWDGLSGVNQGFFIAAAFFSVFFVWQLLAALMGLGGDEADADMSGDGDVDVGGDADAHLDGHDVAHDFKDGAIGDSHETTMAFKLFSVRSLTSFGTLFSWAGAIYLQAGTGLTLSLIYALIWGLVAALAISAVFTLLYKLTETGNVRISTTVGTAGAVYIDIPENGLGEARVTVSGTIAVLRARGVGGKAIKSGTRIVVTRLLGPNTIEVELADAHKPSIQEDSQ